MRLCDIVGYNRSQQRVNRAQTCKRETRNNSSFESDKPINAGHINALFSKKWSWETRGNVANRKQSREIEEERNHRHHDQSHQCGRYFFRNEWEKPND